MQKSGVQRAPCDSHPAIKGNRDTVLEHEGDDMKYILTAVAVSVLIVGAVFIAGKNIGHIIGKIVDRIFREEY